GPVSGHRIRSRSRHARTLRGEPRFRRAGGTSRSREWSIVSLRPELDRPRPTAGSHRGARRRNRRHSRSKSNGNTKRTRFSPPSQGGAGAVTPGKPGLIQALMAILVGWVLTGFNPSDWVSHHSDGLKSILHQTSNTLLLHQRLASIHQRPANCA